MFNDVINFIRKQFGTEGFIPLHEPWFNGREKEYVDECIDSTIVSSVGKFVDRFEEEIARYTGADYAVATVNGTSALHIALLMAGVEPGNEVITQPLTFIATANAISYCGGIPCFVDVDRDTLGLSATALRSFLESETELDAGSRINRTTKRRITACVPMHTFGHPCRIDEIVGVCNEFGIPVVEDAAESFGSYYKDKHTGTFGNLGVFSFNGNKTITCGGGGAIVTDNEALAKRAKHITTTAKVPHRWEFVHDEIGYNYRMPNLNAALACAQLEHIDSILQNKRKLAEAYKVFFPTLGILFFNEPEYARSNCWLNAVILANETERDTFLEATNDAGVMTRPIWRLMNRLNMFKTCPSGTLENAEWLEARVVNIPSSVVVK